MRIAILIALTVAGCSAVSHREGGAAGHGAAQGKEAGKEQTYAPIEKIDTWLNGLHVAKNDADHVFEANHYCDVVDDDLIQCALYDKSGPRAHLVGVEYVLSAEAFERLPTKERELWHPHNYEVLSGLLVAPGMAAAKEDSLMRRMLNTYGKTWHTWPGMGEGGHTAEVPVGEPELAWSFNADGEAPRDLVQARDERYDIDPAEVRDARAPLVRDAQPQEGVNAMAKDFPNRRPIKGVREIYPTDRQQGPGTR